PALGLRLHPTDEPGMFQLERFDVRPLRFSRRPPARETSIHPRKNARLNIVYVLKGAGLCGGVKVVMEQASRLAARGHRVQVYYLTGSVDWFARSVPALRFRNLESLQKALRRFRGIKVATWHETAPWVAASLRRSDRGYYLIQDIEDCYATSAE